MHPPGPPLARPVLPRDRGVMDRVIEYLVGDGPQNRYTLKKKKLFSFSSIFILYGGPDVQITSTNDSMQKHVKDSNDN